MSDKPKLHFLTQNSLNMKPIAPSELPRTHFDPAKDRAWKAMSERINTNRVFKTFGKK